MTIASYMTGERSELEAASRQQCDAVSLGNGTILCRVLGQYKMYATSSDITVTPHLCLDGYWESWVTLALCRAVQPAYACVDVGANHGYYTLIMADAAGPAGRVLAIEPNPDLADLVRLTVTLNGFEKSVTVLERAATDIDATEVQLVIPRHRLANATICRSAEASDDVRHVQTVSLDRAVEDWPKVDLVKIDAEGAEHEIWRGMRETLARNSMITLIMEVNVGRYPDPAAFLDEIVSAGFILREIATDSTIQVVTADDILHGPHVDHMLFLQRS